MATHSGLRGRYGLDLTPAVVRRAVEGLVALLRERDAPKSLGVARDERPQGQELAGEVIAVAAGAGLDVVDFGCVSTPTAKLAARLRGLGGAVIVTASHLGPEWNGLKLVAAPGYTPIDVRELPTPTPADGRLPGRVFRDDSAASDHADAICRSVDAEAIRAARLRVEVAGGVGALSTFVLEQLGCRSPGPACDVGLLLDPDGDRLQLVDERGEVLDPEFVLPLAAVACAPRVIVKGADTSRIVDDVAAAQGSSVHVVTPGELHLVAGLAQARGELAGEGNGGVVIPSVGAARDGLAAAVAILALRARANRPLSELAAELPSYVRRRSTLPCPREADAQRALAALAARLGVASPADSEVGIGVEVENGAWGLVRRSATEPVLRITAEARSAVEADVLHSELLAGLLDAPAHP